MPKAPNETPLTVDVDPVRISLVVPIYRNEENIPDLLVALGSRLIQHQQMMAAAMATAEAKLRASLSYRVWMRRQSFSRPKVRSMAFRAR